MSPLRLLLPLAAAVALLPASASAATPGTVAGPAGVSIVKPPPTVECPPGSVATGAAFTKASRRRGVRSVRFVVQGTGVRKVVRAPRRGTGRVQRFTLAGDCSRSFRVKVEARDARNRVLKAKSWLVKPKVAVGDDGRPIGAGPGGGAIDPGADVPDPNQGKPVPGANQTDPTGTQTSWAASADPRISGPRDGQVCVQPTATPPGSHPRVFPSFCGLYREDVVFAATRRHDDPAGGGERLVLAGAVDTSRVRGVAVTGPDGVQALALSPKRDGRDYTDGSFVAVYDAARTTVDQLALTVTLADGTTQTFPSPTAVNLRTSSGARQP
jgi:hypothetical protein